MASKVIPMKVISSVVAFVDGAEMNVAEVCRTAGVSRKTFYKYVSRYRLEGEAALEPRSRRPNHSPHQITSEVEDAVIAKRKELFDAGLDHGATTIQWHLGRSGGLRVPSVATVHRVLVRRGFITPQPQKRPKGSWRRFEASAPNERWQIDATDVTIATGVVKVFNIIDDHSRVSPISRAVDEATSVEAWLTFCLAAQRWGLPASVLSDNGLCFSGKLRGFEVFFEAKLRDAGIRPITGRAYHPQTTGKVERFQQTLKKWLAKQPLAADLDELQGQLDVFNRIYNFERPHQGIGRRIPIERFNTSIAAIPAARALERPEFPGRSVHATVNDRGNLQVRRLIINIGIEYSGADAVVRVDDHHAAIYVKDRLVRHLKIDHSRAYQPSGRRRGGPRRQRLTS